MFDIAAALTGILLCAPILLAVACIIKCSSQGPILFRQQRAGMGRKGFAIYKFRTMVHGAERYGPLVTRANDKRITRVGRTLRKLKLDELPQFFNVLRGDMSMVGPRPKLHCHERMQMFCRPGITGAATLAFAREEELLSTIPDDEVESYTVNVLNLLKAELDTQYARTGTLFSDCRIILKTLAM
jgi:lipopolysaccharide/colanic/teichoic acid biosynthesis glycosyltransferase